MSLARPTGLNFKQSERSALVDSVFGPRRRHAVESSLQELEGLSLAAGATVVLRCAQERRNLIPHVFSDGERSRLWLRHVRRKLSTSAVDGSME